jgi:hypothetical protein
LTAGTNFPDNAICEDTTFTIVNLCAAKSIRFLDRELYTNHRENSHLSLVSDERRLLVLSAMNICEEWLRQNCDNPDIWASFYVCKMHSIMSNYDQAEKHIRPQIKSYINDYLQSFDQGIFVRLLHHPFFSRGAKQRMLELHSSKINLQKTQDSSKSRGHKTPFISVVIPAHNAEKTFWRCIRSLDAALGQVDHEILVIDDASSDRTAAIVQKLMEVYENVYLIQQQKRQGLEAVRNRGLNEACGKFLWFVDANDEVLVKNFKDLDIRQACNDHDVVMFRYNQSISGTERAPSWNYNAKIMKKRPANDFTVAEFPLVLITYNSTCNKFFRRESILNAGINLLDNAVCDDVTFTVANLCAAKSIYFLDQELYIYHSRNLHLLSANDEQSLPVSVLDNIRLTILRRKNHESALKSSLHA